MLSHRHGMVAIAVTGLSGLAAQVATATPAQTIYAYDCTLKLPLTETSEYEYQITASVVYDNEKFVMSEIISPKMSLFLVENGVRTYTYLKAQPLDVATRAERFAVLDYKNAAYSLNARLSLTQGPELAKAKVYHIHTERFGVSSTETTACAVSVK